MSEVVGCAAYAAGRRVADLTVDELPQAADHPDWFVWIGLHEPGEALLKHLQAIFGLHDLAVEDAMCAHQRPKIEEYDDTVFVVLRTVQAVQPEAGKAPIQLGETHLFVGPRFVISVRHGASSSYAAVRTRCEATPGLLAKGPDFVLYAIMDFVVDGYFPVVDQLEEDISRIEHHIFADVPRRNIPQRIYRLKRELLLIKRAILPLVEVCNRLLRFDFGSIDDDCKPYFRDVYDHVLRINERLDGLRDLLSGALEANLSLISVRQNDIMKQLAAWAAIFAVPTMIAGVYGMNFEDMPELHWRHGYPFAWALMLGTAGSLYVFFKRREWL
jgi:magnesium transporter